jgi:hypothetical protein
MTKAERPGKYEILEGVPRESEETRLVDALEFEERAPETGQIARLGKEEDLSGTSVHGDLVEGSARSKVEHQAGEIVAVQRPVNRQGQAAARLDETSEFRPRLASVEQAPHATANIVIDPRHRSMRVEEHGRQIHAETWLLVQQIRPEYYPPLGQQKRLEGIGECTEAAAHLVHATVVDIETRLVDNDPW